VGHIARAMESAGIPTVIVAMQAFQKRIEALSVARLLLTHHPMGKPLGMPFDHDEHTRILREALQLLEDAEELGTTRFA
jgi:hypothetical protein